MDLETAIRTRRSIRKFTAASVADETIRELLEVARWAPSWANTQGWGVHVLGGEALARLSAAYRDAWERKVERRFDLPPQRRDWPAPLRERTRRLVAARAAATGVAPDAPPAFPADLFAAPRMVLFTVDEHLEAEYACFDAGLLVQSFCLAAHARGLGTCIMAMAVAYADVLRELVPQARGQRFVVGVAVGVPDAQAPVNRFPRERAALDEIATFSSA
jgi:nitroreductase